MTAIELPDLSRLNEKSVRMLSAISRPVLLSAWVTLLVAVAYAAASSGVSIPFGFGALWFAACVVPPSVMLMAWRGTPPLIMAEILHAVDRRD